MTVSLTIPVVVAFMSWASAILGQHDRVSYCHCLIVYCLMCWTHNNAVTLNWVSVHMCKYCDVRHCIRYNTVQLGLGYILHLCSSSVIWECEWHQLCFRAVLVSIPPLPSCYNLWTEHCTHILFFYSFIFFHQLLSPCCFSFFSSSFQCD